MVGEPELKLVLILSP